MTVKHVSTLGAHPITLMKKLATAGGLTVLSEEYYTRDGVDLPVKMVAQIKAGLYIEASDRFYEYCKTNARWPDNLPGYAEALEEHKSQYVTGSYCISQFGVGAANYVETLFPNADWSALVTLPHSSAVTGSNGFSITASAVDVNKVVLTGELADGEAITSHSYSALRLIHLSAPGRAGALAWPFGIVASGLNQGGPYSNNTELFDSYAASGVKQPKLLVLASCHFRIATSVDAENALVNPTTEDILPIFTDILSDGDGLVFFVPSSKGALLRITEVATADGNGLAGTFPVYYKDVPLAYNSLSLAESVCCVLGDETSASAVVPMSPYAPALPIANDSVKGGPVVSKVFAYNTNEVRGSVPGVLACSENLAVGTIGWLDSAKYKVVKPGRMVRIG